MSDGTAAQIVEMCAQLCDHIASLHADDKDRENPFDNGAYTTAMNLAHAIRALSPATPGSVLVPVDALVGLKERIKAAYGNLPPDKFPGPPDGILRTIDLMLAVSKGVDHE